MAPLSLLARCRVGSSAQGRPSPLSDQASHCWQGPLPRRSLPHDSRPVRLQAGPCANILWQFKHLEVDAVQQVASSPNNFGEHRSDMHACCRCTARSRPQHRSNMHACCRCMAPKRPQRRSNMYACCRCMVLRQLDDLQLGLDFGDHLGRFGCEQGARCRSACQSVGTGTKSAGAVN